MEEVWKNIKDFESYQISSLGHIRNPYGKLLKQSPNKKGYMRVWLSNNKIKHKQFFVHRLVAQAFIPNTNKYPQINHKDTNTQNNCVDNLEWCDNIYNQRYSNALSVVQYSSPGDIIKTWSAISDISRELNIPSTNICKCCKGQILTINGYIFLYKGKNIRNRLLKLSNRKHKSKYHV